MSDTPDGFTYDAAEQLSRIYRALDEAAKLRAKAAKLEAKRDKLAGEQRKFHAEADKLMRDRAWLPWQVVAAGFTAAATVAGATAGLMTVLR